MKKIGIIHTTPATIDSLNQLVKEIVGDVEVINFLDDSILKDMRDKHNVDFVRERWISYAKVLGQLGADAVLSACSTVGAFAEEADKILDVPVYRIDEIGRAMCSAAVEMGEVVSVFATLASTLEPTVDLIERKAYETGKRIKVNTVLVEGAYATLMEGHKDVHDAKIKALVEQGRWHIMGGWYLQPDCNMPSGESFVRQILKGRCYFRDRFHVDPATAINFDSFGHSRGLVQIMKKCGYDSYVVCRPGQKDFALEDNDFLWVGCDGSEIMVHRIVNGYSSGRGRIKEKADKYLEQNPGVENALLLWGIGNHGGGPSKEDLEMIRKMI